MVWEFNVTIGSDLGKYDYKNGTTKYWHTCKERGLPFLMSSISTYVLLINPDDD